MKILDNKYAKNFDFIMLLVVIIISAMGIFNLYGSLSLSRQFFLNPYVIKQLVWLAISFMIMIAILSFDYNVLIEVAYYIFIAIFLLIIVDLL